MDLSGTTFIRRPVDVVYDYVMDLSHDSSWRTGVAESGLRPSVTLGPGAVGYTRAGKADVEWRVSAFSPGESIDWELLGEGPVLGTGGYRFLPVEGGTQFTLVADVRPGGVYRLIGPLFYWMGRRRNQSDVERLRDILESA